jgi:hypothetical protein
MFKNPNSEKTKNKFQIKSNVQRFKNPNSESSLLLPYLYEAGRHE